MSRANTATAVTLWAERLLWSLALFCLAWGSVHLVQRRAAARAHHAEVSALLTRQPALPLHQGEAIPAATLPPRPLSLGAPIGEIHVPRLGLSAPVVEGDDDERLTGAAGHLLDTPLPWHGGNSAIAAHRDTLFRPLQHIRTGDRIELRTSHGVLHYLVRDTLIVRPDEVWVLEQGAGRTLTLITCYPFRYVGRAPKRFIVRADPAGPAIQ